MFNCLYINTQKLVTCHYVNIYSSPGFNLSVALMSSCHLFSFKSQNTCISQCWLLWNQVWTPLCRIGSSLLIYQGCQLSIILLHQFSFRHIDYKVSAKNKSGFKFQRHYVNIGSSLLASASYFATPTRKFLLKERAQSKLMVIYLFTYINSSQPS